MHLLTNKKEYDIFACNLWLFIKFDFILFNKYYEDIGKVNSINLHTNNKLFLHD